MKSRFLQASIICCIFFLSFFLANISYSLCFRLLMKNDFRLSRKFLILLVKNNRNVKRQKVIKEYLVTDIFFTLFICWLPSLLKKRYFISFKWKIQGRILLKIFSFPPEVELSLLPEIKVNIVVGLGKSHCIKDGGIICFFLDVLFVKSWPI